MDWKEITKGKPFLTNNQVVSLLKESYGYEVIKVTVLDSYDCQNFLVDVAPLNQGTKSLETDELTVKYVLKVTNSYLSKDEQDLRDVTHIMEFLSSRGFPCTKPVPNKNGDLCQLLTFQNLSFKTPGSCTSLNKNLEDTFMIRLVTFLPETVLNTLPLVPNNVFEEMGETLAQMHLALQELDMDKIALQEMSENFSWSLDCVNKAREYLYVVEDSDKRQLVEDVMNEFERVVLSRKEELPHGFIHGDFNDVNIIVDFQEGKNECCFSGFIDFDDAVYSCTVYDIGIALMYILQSKATSSNSAAKYFLQGYSKYRKMTQLEKDCLIYCIAGRFVQSLLGGLFHCSIYRDEYCLLTQQRGWDALKEMWTRGKKVSFQNWNFS
ncbi:Hydroxylysine kinase [Holothuria leucospilota]|uniref:Hydroxylysine kinase n=1 Tax=Holothuria leucospilota TaxID=206669 RepID=A0A9Q1BET0_HOLLE|nr:Hydroxylysine kinase [Holothuria leucospilota]